MAASSEVCEWLRSISNGLDLQRLAPLFESRGFRNISSLAYLEKNDLEVIINSPHKLLLAEKRIIEKELNSLKQPVRSTAKELFPDQTLQVNKVNTVNIAQHNSISSTLASSASAEGSKTRAVEPDIGLGKSAGSTQDESAGYLQRKGFELTENMTVLRAQVASAQSQLNLVKHEYDQSCSRSSGRKGKLCSNCHQSGHYKGKCVDSPCRDFRICNASEKHPEAKNEVLELQKLVKELEKKEKKANEELDSFKLAKERSLNSFFAAMRPRLRRQNEGRYTDRFALDKI